MAVTAWCYKYITPPPPPSPSLLFGQPRTNIRDFRCRCSSNELKHPKKKKKENDIAPTPQLLKIAVSGLTEFLRLFSSPSTRLDMVKDVPSDELLVSSIDDVVKILESDYENAYFVTGIFTSAIYVDDCIFEDPTIKFRGKALYLRNLKLLVPFFVQPSITLQKIEKVNVPETKFILASWRLRTFLKLPWRPFIFIDGRTEYNLNDEFKIIRHAESWNISALEAIGQIFTTSFGKTGG